VGGSRSTNHGFLERVSLTSGAWSGGDVYIFCIDMEGPQFHVCVTIKDTNDVASVMLVNYTQGRDDSGSLLH
jgi:hypothetical protein